MTEIEAMILINQSLILTALSVIITNKPLSDLLLEQAERSGNFTERTMANDTRSSN